MTANGPESDELFCLGFEVRTLADTLIRHEAERWVPGYTPASVEREHRRRYRWAQPFARGRRVLDVACGVGWGSRLLASQGAAAEVVACDIDADAVRYGSVRHAHERVRWVVGDAAALPDELGTFDLVVSFETIEHLREPDRFLAEAARRLRPGGLFIVSTPVATVPLNARPDNRHHVQEWGWEAFHQLLSRHFAVEQSYLQLRPQVPSPVRPGLWSPAAGLFRRLRAAAAGLRLPRGPTGAVPPSAGAASAANTDMEPFLLTSDLGFWVRRIGTTVAGYAIVVCRPGSGA